MSTPLSALLKQRIRHQGQLSMAAYMEACLYHPEHGYYTRGLNFSTMPARDFITAPEITPLFGYTLANWVNKAWQRLGSPGAFMLAEAGPGRGTLMHDVLTQLQSAHPTCYAVVKPWLVETSPTLTKIQQETLQSFPRCSWSQSLPTQTEPLIVVGNELLDAFPIHQYIFKNNKFSEIVIDLSASDELILKTIPHTLIPSYPHPRSPTFSEGTILETSPSQSAWLADMKSKASAALLIDYGYRSLPRTGGDTLQALHRHQKVGVLHLPGESDLTTHVNFAQVMELLGHQNSQLEDLAPFLLAHGIIGLGLQHPLQQPALQRLLHPAQMGSLFKVVEFNRSTH